MGLYEVPLSVSLLGFGIGTMLANFHVLLLILIIVDTFFFICILLVSLIFDYTNTITY